VLGHGRGLLQFFLAFRGSNTEVGSPFIEDFSVHLYQLSLNFISTNAVVSAMSVLFLLLLRRFLIFLSLPVPFFQCLAFYAFQYLELLAVLQFQYFSSCEVSLLVFKLLFSYLLDSF